MSNRSRLLVTIIVLAGHGACILLWKRWMFPVAMRGESAIVVTEWLDTERIATSQLKNPREPTRNATNRSVATSAPRDRSQTPPSSTSTTISLSHAPIDWTEEAHLARERALTADNRGPQRFGATPVSPYQPCKRRASSFEWDPEPRKAGLYHGLPYVIIKDRCVVGLGFFGCKLDAKPPANGRLFDDLNKADRIVGSVPDTPDCVPSRKADRDEPAQPGSVSRPP
ncbi:MAG: hypothetical protein R3E77_11715 [Steroidobacteraceae bacterium]